MRKYIFSDTVLEKEISLPIGQTPIFDPETGYSYVPYKRTDEGIESEERFYFDSCRQM